MFDLLIHVQEFVKYIYFYYSDLSLIINVFVQSTTYAQGKCTYVDHFPTILATCIDTTSEYVFVLSKFEKATCTEFQDNRKNMNLGS